MRVVEPDDRETTGARATPRVDVRSGIDQKTTRGIVGQVRAAHGIDNGCRRAEKNAAAFVGRGRTGVRGNLGQHGRRDANGYEASTTIAMPMPPPMHNDATP